MVGRNIIVLCFVRIFISMNIKEEIIKIKNQNPDLSNQDIAKKIGCAKSTVRYHLTPEEKEAVRNRVRKLRKSQHPLYRKIIGYCNDYGMHKKSRYNKNPIFSLTELLSQVGNTPTCYLTGDPIDILEMKTYSLDHKIPLSQGGKSTIENCGLTTRQSNVSKNGMTPNEFFAFCKKVLLHNGYKITDP